MSTEPITKPLHAISLNLSMPSFQGSYRKGWDAYHAGVTECPYDSTSTPGRKHFAHWKAGYADAERGINRLTEAVKKNKS